MAGRYDVIETDDGFMVRDTLDGALIGEPLSTVTAAWWIADAYNAPAVDGPKQVAA